MNGTNFAELDKEIQASTKRLMKKKKRNAYECKKKIGFSKFKSVRSKRKQELISDQPVKLESKRRRTKVNDVYMYIEDKFSVVERADRVLSSLKSEFPYFLKYMLPSNVCYSFWMILPTKFCKLYLPKCDSTITLVDEQGAECKATYLFVRRGLSAGWRGFSISHKLLKGDVLIFQLIDQCKFKVHIVRVYDPDVVDAAHCLMSMASGSGTPDSDLGKKRARRYTRKKKPANCGADAEAAYV